MKKILGMMVVGAALMVSVNADVYTSVSGSLKIYGAGSPAFGSTVTGSVYVSPRYPDDASILLGAVYQTGEKNLNFVSTAAGAPSPVQSSDVSSAFAGDDFEGMNVNITNWITLTQSATVQSLRFQQYTQNYELTLNNSSTLTIESGGIIFNQENKINNGFLQAGDGRNLWIRQANGMWNTISSNIIGSGGLEIYSNWNAGLTLSGSNSFSGDVWIGGERIRLYLGSTSALGDSKNVKVSVTDANEGSEFNFTAGGTFKQNFDIARYKSSFITGTTKTTLDGNFKTSSYGDITFSSGSGGILTVNGTVSSAGRITLSSGTGGQIIMNGNLNANTDGASMSDSNYALTLTGGGAITLSGTVTPNPNTVIGANTTVNLVNQGKLALKSYGLVLRNSATFNHNGGEVSQVTSKVTMESNSVYNLNSGTLNVTSGDPGTNLFVGTGTVNFNGGVVRLNPDNNNNRNLTDSNGSVLNVQAGGAVFEVVKNTLTAPTALKHAGSGRDGGLKKSGAGTLILSGANTYNGSTIVSSGTLRLAQNATLKFEMLQEGSAFEINKIDNTGGGIVDLSLSGVKLNINLDALVEPSADKTWTLFDGISNNYSFGSNLAANFVNFSVGTWDYNDKVWTWEIEKDVSYYTFNLDTTSADFGLLTFTTLNNIPEPSTLFLLGTGVVLLAVLRRRK